MLGATAIRTVCPAHVLPIVNRHIQEAARGHALASSGGRADRQAIKPGEDIHADPRNRQRLVHALTRRTL